MKNKNLTKLIISMIALFGIAYAGAEEVLAQPEGKAFKKISYGERMYTADDVDIIVGNIPFFDPYAENVRLGRNSYGSSVVLFAAGENNRPPDMKHGDPQCGNVTIGSAATNLNVCSVVIGKEAVGKNFGGVTLGFKVRNDDSHSTAVGYGSKIISTVTPDMFCAYENNGHYVPSDFFRPNTGFANTAVNGYIKDSYAGTTIGTEFGWTQNELHGLFSAAQSVAIGKLAYVGPESQTGSVVRVNDGVSIGTAARTFADDGTAVGYGATAKGFRSVAIGCQAHANAQDSIVIGRGTATAPGQIIIGGKLMATMENVDEVVSQLRAENEALRAQLTTIQNAAAQLLDTINNDGTVPMGGAKGAPKKEFTLEDFLKAIAK